jgi:DNA-binding transcriptional LysR family regulator
MPRAMTSCSILANQISTWLGQERLILENTSSLLLEMVVETFSQCQTPLRISVENAPIELLKEIVALRLGVGFVPLMCVAEEVARGEFKMIPIEQFHADLPLWLARRRTEHSEAAKVFTALTEELFRTTNKQKEKIDEM